MIGILLVLLCVTLPSTADQFENDIDDVMPILSELAARSGHGSLRVEHAAFLVREQDGSYSCVLWERTGGFMRTQTQRSIPAGTVAIAHTHPSGSPVASTRDREEAARLGIPFVVVGRDTLHVVDSLGHDAILTSGVRWSRWSSSRRSCIEPQEG